MTVVIPVRGAAFRFVVPFAAVHISNITLFAAVPKLFWLLCDNGYRIFCKSLVFRELGIFWVKVRG